MLRNFPFIGQIRAIFKVQISLIAPYIIGYTEIEQTIIFTVNNYFNQFNWHTMQMIQIEIIIIIMLNYAQMNHPIQIVFLAGV